MISGKVAENCALGYYTASIGNFLRYYQYLQCNNPGERRVHDFCCW